MNENRNEICPNCGQKLEPNASQCKSCFVKFYGYPKKNDSKRKKGYHANSKACFQCRIGLNGASWYMTEKSTGKSLCLECLNQDEKFWSEKSSFDNWMMSVGLRFKLAYETLSEEDFKKHFLHEKN